MPRRFKNNASKLLKFFNQNGEQITFNSSGTIFIDQVAIGKSNIFEIFPVLFKNKKTSNKIPGLNDFLEKLHGLGLTHLISLKKVQIESPQKSIFPLSKESSNFWYLG